MNNTALQPKNTKALKAVNPEKNRFWHCDMKLSGNRSGTHTVEIRRDGIYTKI
jgi:hypothetical protein